MNHKFSPSLHSACALLILVLGLLASPVSADVGLPPAHPGWSISPGNFTTNVQMVSEKVLIDIHADPYQADVDAVFNMLNQGGEQEAFDVWFPLGEEIFAGKENRIFKVDDFRAWIDDLEADVTIDGLDEGGLVWAHWPVRFPAGEPVVLRVTYKLSPALVGEVYWHQRFEYILETGAGWLGVIETAHITVRSPYSLTEPNRLFQIGDPFFVRPLGYAIAGDELSWTFYDLEPGPEHNIDFYLFDPDDWRSLLEAHEDIQSGGGSGESHWDFAHLLSLWLGAFESRDYPFLPSPPVSPVYERVVPRIVDSYVKALEAGLVETHHLSSVIRHLHQFRSFSELPELDGFFQEARALRPDDVELDDLYTKAIARGLADGVVPPTPTPPTEAAQPPTQPAIPAIPAGSPTSSGASATSLITGVVCLLIGGLILILFVRGRRSKLE